MASICLLGRLSEQQEGVWTWKGEWAFGDKVENGLPFDYSFANPEKEISARPPPASAAAAAAKKEEEEAKKEAVDEETVKKPDEEKLSETQEEKQESVALEQQQPAVVHQLNPSVPPSSSKEQAVAVTETKESDPVPPVAAPIPPVAANQPNPASAPSKEEDVSQSTAAAPVKTEDPPPELPRIVQIHGHKLPASGKWNGCFMTLASARKGAQKQPHVPVQEEFSISWSELPVSSSEERTTTTKRRIQVTGKGENQYGRFELSGALDLGTFMLQCQRQYVLQDDSELSAPRSYHTRKRQLTWKRRAALDEEPLQLKKLPATKKSKLSIHVPTSGPKKRQAAPKQQAGFIKLPSTGDPMQARWRAAHFFHYQPASDATQAKYVVYEGELLHQKRHGRGICLYNNGMLYEGEWKMDKEHGNGKLMTSNRKHVAYEGLFERGRMHGEGIYRYSETSHYAGEFRENLRHGDGVYRLEDGSVYDGAWRDGAMCGRGVFTWPDGSVYDGEWKDNRRHGVGLLKTAGGFTYDGAWVNNSMEGRGSATYPKGQEYHGMWSRGRREGRGTIHFTNGAVYEGRFKNDAIDGQGTLKIAKTLTVETEGSDKPDFMIPVSFQSDLGHIHRKAGFSNAGQ